MTRVIDLGNGYGRVEGYRSEYASLTFPLTKSEILRLYHLELLSRDEAQNELLKMGYELPATKWAVAVAGIGHEQWRKAIERAGAI